MPPATEADFEEEPADTPDATGPAAYKARLVALIRERYDSDDETALLRQRDTKPEEFAAYNAYVERCKTIAREAVTVNPADDGSAAADVLLRRTDQTHGRTVDGDGIGAQNAIGAL